MTGDYTITFHDSFRDTDDEIVERTAFANEVNRELLPDDPPTPPEQAIAAQRASPERLRRYVFRARDTTGSLVAAAGCRIDPEHDDNPDVLWFGIDVIANHRRRGLGARLLAEIVGVARLEDRTRLMSVTHETVPAGRTFAEALGARHTFSEHTNHLPIDAVDRAQLEGWVADAPMRAADYELFGWDGPCPDEWMDQYIDIIHVMNTAPREEMNVNDFTLTPDQVREHERVRLAMGSEWWTLVIRHRESGEWAGFHDVVWEPSNPKTVFVDSTGVRPEHRGHAIGKWLKAAMTLRIIEERPAVTSIRTGNADSNDAMLGINKAMGYRPLLGHSAWEVGVDAAQKWIADRGFSPSATPSR